MRSIRRKSQIFLNNRIFLITFIFIGLSAFLSPIAYLQSQNKEVNEIRMLEKAKQSNLPIKIVLIKSKKGVIETDKNFSTGEDWLKGLTVELQNRADKPLNYVSLKLIFNRPEDQESQLNFAATLGYGVNPLGIEQPDSTTLIPSIQPEGKLQIKLSDQEYEAIFENLQRLNYTTTKKVKLLVAMLGFSDGSIWIGGRMYKQDKENPGKLIPLEKKEFTVSTDLSNPVKEIFSVKQVSNNASPPTSQCYGDNIGFHWTYCPWIDEHDGTRCRIFNFDANGEGNVHKKTTVQSRCEREFTRGRCIDTRTQEQTLLEDCPIPPVGCEPPDIFGGCRQGTIMTGDGWCCPFLNECLRPVCLPEDPDCCPRSPILIDISGNGFAMTNKRNGVLFDFNSDGIRNQTSWTVANTDDAWLALDRNGNGTIDNASELFGDATAQPAPSSGQQKNGFLALAVFDKVANGGNNDGQINRNDMVFSALKLWQDRNHNGISESNEMQNLSQSPIRTIELDYRESRRTDAHGNQFKYRAKVKDERGAQVGRWAWDVFLILE